MSIYRITRKSKASDLGNMAGPQTDPDQEAGLREEPSPGDEASPEEDEKETAEGYLQKAIKLIPADVVAAYLALRNVWMPAEGAGEDALGQCVSGWFLPIGGFVAVILLRILGSSDKFGSFKDIQWPVVWVSSIAYIAWVLSFGDAILGYDAPDPRIAASLLILISIIGPSFVKPVAEET